ncbi:Rad17-domain-containing protein [Lactarius psammicola]|nr:Rad17-domain-containing protein [Lactarius psammicola]
MSVVVQEQLWKGAKDVTILSVRGHHLYWLRAFPLTLVDPPKLSQHPVLKPGNKPPSSVAHLSNVVGLASATVKDAKGKGKAIGPAPEENPDDRLWADKYEPRSLGDLAVHKRKVDDVRRWLVEAFSEQGRSERRRLLILTGPAGSGKTATLRVLAQEMNFEIIEHKTHVNTVQASTFTREPSTSDTPDAFATFLARAGAYTSIFTSARQKLVLVEDLPNILHPTVRARFHDALRAHVERGSSVAPVVLVVSDAGLCVEASSSGSSSRDVVIDARTVVPPGFPAHCFTEIRFNTIAPTLLASALKRVTALANVRLSQSILNSVIEGAGGDVRSAIMTLEFTCARPASWKQSSRSNVGSIISMTQKENALLLFHLIGKIMYNKRKGDPHPNSASAKDISRERALDRTLNDPPPLPPWLTTEERRTSRVDVDLLYASTPVDASLFGLYVHQNYTQYCSSLEQCSSLIDNLSWTDANNPENWYDANPHAFHIQALGSLHSLPSPVPRTGQRIFKPAFFGSLQKQESARDALDRTSNWLSSTGLWSRVAIATELGGMLRALGRRAPHGHHAFSELVFGQHSIGAELMREGDIEAEAVDRDEGEIRETAQSHTSNEGATCLGYLEDDEIEEW